MRALLPAILTVFIAMAGELPVNLDPIQSDGDWLTYDDGTPSWLTWGGTYRGVWFNMDDFIPGSGDVSLGAAEFWFYHSADRPWDTGDVYVEIWNGGAMGPTVQLDQQMLTAVHYSPVYAEYEPFIIAEPDFWALANTEMSAGGWPSTLGDGAQGTVYHSFYSDDFIVWEPWEIGGACNYFIRIELGWDFSSGTWGSLKATF